MALTFDDGPGPYTDRLLQVLKDNDAKATFFLIGNKVAANPAGARRIADAGMEIGSHSMTHRPPSTLSSAELSVELRESKMRIESGQDPKITGVGRSDGRGGGHRRT